MSKELENAWAVQEIWQDKCYKLEQERDFFKEQAILWRNDYKNEYEENRKLKERIDILYEFIERNDKLVDEVIDEEDLDKLNRYIYIDDDLIDKSLESED